MVPWASAGTSGFWRRDPITGRDWPGTEARFLGIDLRSSGHDPAGPLPGDVKFVWEPARLQVLHPLAALAAGGDLAAGRLALTILRHFSDANPPHRGVHWCSGIELAMRLVAVTLLVAALGRDGLDREDRVMIRRFVAAHARQIAAFPSLHSSANNHRVAEGLGLFLAGILVPDLDEAWEPAGRAVLEREALAQILPDGAGAEQSPSYQAFACEMIAFAGLIGVAEGRPFAPAVIDRLVAAAGFLRTLMDLDGHVPAIGDDDESRVVAQPPDREPRYVASVVAAIAGLTGRADLLPPARDPHLRDALFAVPAGFGHASDGVSLFRDGGYTVVHQGATGRRFDLVVDHGPLGYLALAAHGHADALAVWFGIDGIPILIDPGTALYNAGGPMRLALRESRSHNTLCIAGASQSRASSAFSWSNRAHTT
ncbi:heparinase II/III family protein, partial [uncultured Methylobacterium sp.]|uniref:heparinase II/III domain-containing protein n=1 Tax=uncultured Methylobacterium sp. TaxID=157278 RepID=UPI0035CA7447